MLADRIIRSKRRTVSLQIDEKAHLVVRVPVNFREEQIIQVVEASREWISKHRSEVKKRISKSRPKRFVDGEEFLYLGRYHRLNITAHPGKSLMMKEGTFIMSPDVDDRKRAFIDWYRASAMRKLLERIELMSIRTGLSYSRISITNAQKRWGSCSKGGRINFSWRLVMAPEEVIDYVVLHELAHTVFHDHSERFWNLVSKNMPDYPSRENWLKDNVLALRL